MTAGLIDHTFVRDLATMIVATGILMRAVPYILAGRKCHSVIVANPRPPLSSPSTAGQAFLLCSR
jgi:hypothetical protein